MGRRAAASTGLRGGDVRSRSPPVVASGDRALGPEAGFLLVTASGRGGTPCRRLGQRKGPRCFAGRNRGGRRGPFLTESAAETAIAPAETAEYAVAPAEPAGPAEAAKVAETTAESIVDVRLAQNHPSLLLHKKSFSSDCSVCAGNVFRQGGCYIHRKCAPVLCRRCCFLSPGCSDSLAGLARKFAEVGGGVCPFTLCWLNPKFRKTPETSPEPAPPRARSSTW